MRQGGSKLPPCVSERENTMRNNKILWITRTGVLVALLVALQWLTSYTQAFAGQYITGSCVNAVLAVAALAAGMWSGAVVAILSPFCAFLLGIGPKLIQVVPAIALGNLVYVVALYFLLGRKQMPVWQQACGLAVSAAAKFAMLYTAVVLVLIPAMGPALPQKQAAAFTVMFSWPQLITALIGGSAALLIVPMIRKEIKK